MFDIITEIYRRRTLIRELVVKNLKVRYSRPMLGFLWAFLSPFFTTVIYYVVFSVILKGQIAEAPFFLYLMSATFTWGIFASTVMSSATSFMDNRNLIKEARFPHYLILVSIAVENVVNAAPALLILIIASAIAFKGLPVFILFLPVLLAVHMALAIGLSLIFSVLYVKWRDTRYALDALLSFLCYMTPIFYSIYFVRDTFTKFLFKLYICNPLTGILNAYRFLFFKGFYLRIKQDIGVVYFLAMPVVFAVFFLWLGFLYYKKNKDVINDYLSY